MVSVIVAVYNVEDYLPRCLDSVLYQTYLDMEIILVDDGSTDNSGSICEDYAKKDERVKVIHQKNEGVSSARNAGLRAATGDYILMIDGDDALHPQMVDTLYDLIISGEYDFSMCYGERINDITVIDDKSKEVMEVFSSIIVTPDMCMENLYMEKETISLQFIVVWNKLYKSKLINDLFFKSLPSRDVLQDSEFNNRVYQKVTKAIFTTSNLYYYIQRPSSFQHMGISLRSVDKIYSHYICLNEIPFEKKQYRAWCMMSLYKNMYRITYRTKNTIYEKKVYDICSYVRGETSQEFLMNTCIPTIRKCILLLLNYCPWLFRGIINLGEWFVLIKKKFIIN